MLKQITISYNHAHKGIFSVDFLYVVSKSATSFYRFRLMNEMIPLKTQFYKIDRKANVKKMRKITDI